MEELMRKFLQGKELSEGELSELDDYAIKQFKGENRRWSQSIQSIVEFDGKFYAIDWERGLTENQENYFGDQPYEVIPVEKVVKTVVYKRVGKKK